MITEVVSDAVFMDHPEEATAGQQEVEQADPFEGIDFFTRFDTQRMEAVEEGEPTKPNYHRAEYYPDKACFRFMRGTGRERRTWRYNVRTNKVSSNLGTARPEDLAVVAQEVDLLKARGIASVLPEGYGYPEIERIITEASGAPVDIRTLEPGSYYLLKDAFEWKVFKFKDVDRAKGYGNEIGVRIIGEVDDSLDRYNNLQIRLHSHVPHAPFVKDAYVHAYSEDATTGNLMPSSEAMKIYRMVDPQDVLTIALLKEPEYDPTIGSERTREELCTMAALEGLQYTRWGKYEGEGNFAHDEAINAQNYAQALDIIIRRFGKETFVKVASSTMLEHLGSLHTELHLESSPFKPHSDIGPLDSELMALAKQVIKDSHPLTDNMRESGHVVNVLSLFGDPDFWAHMREEYPDMFDQLVSYWEDLPPDFHQRGVYAKATVNPVGLIQQYFPDAYAEIIKRKPDFISDVEESIVILPKD